MSGSTYDLMSCRITARAADHSNFTVRATREDRDSWDAFAHACGATFRGAYQGAFAWQARHHLVFMLKRYDVFASESHATFKIGQFVIGVGPQIRVFGDILHLLPVYKDLWPVVMANVLRELGPATYHYGSDWTTEPSRVAPISQIRGTEIITERPVDVYAVRYSDYESWEHFYRSISTNVRRNVAAASRAEVDICFQLSLIDTIRASDELLRLKRGMFLRKGLQFNSIRAYAALASRICWFRKYLFTAKALRSGQSISLFSGLQFGRDLYYLEGASVGQPGGAAWLLLVAMLRSTFERSGGLGTCVLGPDEKEPRNPVAEAAWQNLLRQRLQCRAKPYPTSLVTFRFRPDLSDGSAAIDLSKRNASSRSVERWPAPVLNEP